LFVCLYYYAFPSKQDRFTREELFEKSTMKTQSIILAALAAVPNVLAHTVWSVLYVDGESQVRHTLSVFDGPLTEVREMVPVSA
jgi:hypothetical protein